MSNINTNSNSSSKNSSTTLIIRVPKRLLSVEIAPTQLHSVIGHQDIAHNLIFPHLFQRILTRFEDGKSACNTINTSVTNFIYLMNLARTCKFNLGLVLNYINELASDYKNNSDLFNGIINIDNSNDGILLLLLKSFGHQHPYSKLVMDNYLAALHALMNTFGFIYNREIHFENLTLKNFKRILQVMNVNVTEVLNMDDLCKQITNNSDMKSQSIQITHLRMLARNGFFESQPAILVHVINYALTISLNRVYLLQSSMIENLIKMIIDFAKVGLLKNDDPLVNDQLLRLAWNFFYDRNNIIVDGSKEQQRLAVLEMISTLATQGLLNHTNHSSYAQLVINNYLWDLEQKFISQHDSISNDEELCFENKTLLGFKRILQVMDVKVSDALDLDWVYNQIINNSYKKQCMHIKHLGMLARNGFFESQPAILAKIISYALTINPTQQPEAAQYFLKMVIDFAKAGLLVDPHLNNQLFFMVQPILHYQTYFIDAKLERVALEMITTLASQGLINDNNHHAYTQLFTNNYLMYLELQFINGFSNLSNQEKNAFENTTLKEFKRILQVMNVNIMEVFNIDWFCEQIINIQDYKSQCMHIKHLSMLARNGFCKSEFSLIDKIINYAFTIDPIQQCLTAEYLINLITDFAKAGLLFNSFNFMQDLINNKLLLMINKSFSQTFFNGGQGNDENLQFAILEMMRALAYQGFLNNSYQATRCVINNIFSVADDGAKNNNIDSQCIKTIHDLAKAGLLQNNCDFDPSLYPNLQGTIALNYDAEIAKFIYKTVSIAKRHKNIEDTLDMSTPEILIHLVSVLKPLNPNSDVSEMILLPIKRRALNINPNIDPVACIRLFKIMDTFLNADLLSLSSAGKIINIALRFLESDLKSAQKLKVPALKLLHQMIIWRKNSILTMTKSEQERIKQVAKKYSKSQVQDINTLAYSILRAIKES